MNKESIIAILLGLVLGIVVAIGVVSITVSRQKARNTSIQEKNQIASISGVLKTTAVPPTVTVLQSLQIDSPKSGSITEEKTTRIKGIAGSDSLIVVQSPISTQSLKLDKPQFSIEFPLALGENVITISVYHKGAVIPVQKKVYIYRLII